MYRLVKALKVRSSDDGLSLIEVLVAMMIFAMLVVGIGYSLINILKMTKDSQARETAISLASSELDAVRAIGDPFSIAAAPPPRMVTVGTNTYTVTQTSRWASPDGSVDTCGTGDQPLQYKTVSVKVTWQGMKPGTEVLSDTALMPTSRINNPNLGTILVSVQDDAGLGVAGVTFTASSPAGAIDTTPTNADGCSFLLGVEPGEYTVKLTNSGYMDVTQSANPVLVRTVEAGSSGKFGYQYDKRGTYQVRYATNDPDSVRPKLPSNLTTTFFNTNGRYTSSLSTNAALQGSIHLYPAKTGYDLVAGTYVPVSGAASTSCESVDPAAWEETLPPEPPTVGTRAPTVFTSPGGTSAVTPVPMGILTVSGNKSARFVNAVQQSSPLLPGQPVCDIAPIRFDFGQVFPNTNPLTTTKIALPFGTWKLFVSTNSTALGTQVPQDRIELLSPGDLRGDGTFILDPRGVTP